MKKNKKNKNTVNTFLALTLALTLAQPFPKVVVRMRLEQPNPQ